MVSNCIIAMTNCTQKNESDNERSGLETWFNKCRHIIYLSRSIWIYLIKILNWKHSMETLHDEKKCELDFK